MGYLKRLNENLDAFDVEGYFHTGDIGYINEDGRLQLTGRIKDIVMTAAGESVTPQPIEDHLKTICPLISYCALVGDNRKHISMLMTLKVQYDNWGNPTDKLDQNVQSFLYRKFGSSETATTVKEA